MNDAASPENSVYAWLRERAIAEFCLPIALHKLLYDEDLFDEDNKTRYLAYLYDEENALV